MVDLSKKNICDNIYSEHNSKEKETEVQNNILSMINCPTILTGMSHEMRTHMNSIVAFSFLMNNSGCNEDERKEFHYHILNSCEQLMGLFDNFLESAIIESGNSKADLKKCDLGNMTNDLLSEFRAILKREDHKDLVLILENQFSNQTDVCIDSSRVTKVIRNLFRNALINTKSGYIKIGYYFRDGNATFYVLDSGKGYLKCKEFLQTENLSDSLGRHNDTCSAVNLMLARKLITLMGGNIWIEGNSISGTGVYFTVPVKDAEETQVSINEYANNRIAI
jgi:signal transduction histidine kinase